MKVDTTLDTFDLALLDILQRDNTMPLRKLSEQVHRSSASIQRRIQRLQKIGVICANTAVINPTKVGQIITLVVEVHADRTQATDLNVMKVSFSGPEIQQCYYVTGDADFLLVLTVADMGEFQEIAQRLFYNNPNVKWFRTIVVMDRVKATLDVRVLETPTPNGDR
ncbi:MULTISPECIES: Lrp/AsnC family transcriptional regulator [Pseudomonas]|uniref:Lrp/AsnC family transcriptional regulator n=1 Tax=Pseudomonas gingeri TaxID=117681 RepID=A0A7Y7WPP9_9PSED|nr:MULTISPECIES: Lrp/AsnC family transcriptional regulator [Pseudomonas]MPQ67197.1 AsnC family transcriptional regulator [Pseudomonas sp. MWU12-2323]NWB85102.1 Lrp/AsnC family transcriptional regulator [Pseudomonas gingeri]